MPYEKNIHQPLTEQKNKELEIKVIERTQELQKLIDTKDKLFSIISHDLRSPLHNIKGALELMMEEQLTTEEFLSIIPKLHKSTNNLSQTLDNLLQWSAVQMRGVQVQPQSFEVYKIIKEKIDLLMPLAQEKKIIIENKTDTHTVLFVDVNQFRVIIQNLLSNAIKFTPHNGKIGIETRLQEDFCKICITDSGVGINPELLANLFDVRHSFSSPGTNGEKGTGIGLLLCKEMIEGNKGKIEVESHLSKGTTFRVFIPVYQPKVMVLSENS